MSRMAAVEHRGREAVRRARQAALLIGTSKGELDLPRLVLLLEAADKFGGAFADQVKKAAGLDNYAEWRTEELIRSVDEQITGTNLSNDRASCASYWARDIELGPGPPKYAREAGSVTTQEQ